MPKIIRALSADAHLVVSLLRRETVRSCGGLNGAELPTLCQHSGEKAGQDTCLYYRHTVGTPNILVRAAPRHPANASRHAKKFRVPLTVPELVKQKIAGSRAFGVGSDFVIDDVTGKTLGMVVGVTQ